MSTHTRWPESYDRKSTDEAKAEPNYMSNQREITITMAIDNRYNDEVVDGATNFQRGR